MRRVGIAIAVYATAPRALSHIFVDYVNLKATQSAMIW